MRLTGLATVVAFFSTSELSAQIYSCNGYNTCRAAEARQLMYDGQYSYVIPLTKAKALNCRDVNCYIDLTEYPSENEKDAAFVNAYKGAFKEMVNRVIELNKVNGVALGENEKEALKALYGDKRGEAEFAKHQQIVGAKELEKSSVDPATKELLKAAHGQPGKLNPQQVQAVSEHVDSVLKNGGKPGQTERDLLIKAYGKDKGELAYRAAVQQADDAKAAAATKFATPTPRVTPSVATDELAGQAEQQSIPAATPTAPATKAKCSPIERQFGAARCFEED